MKKILLGPFAPELKIYRTYTHIRLLALQMYDEGLLLNVDIIMSLEESNFIMVCKLIDSGIIE